jgi:hypothetical protein
MRIWTTISILWDTFKRAVGNAAYEASGLSGEKSILPAMRTSTAHMVQKLAYPCIAWAKTRKANGFIEAIKGLFLADRRKEQV